MSIRLESPDPSLHEGNHVGKLRWQRSSRKSNKVKTFLGTAAGHVLICAALVWIVAYIYCHQRYWRDPDSWFYSENGVYDFHYSQLRQNLAAEYIAQHNGTTSIVENDPEKPDPVLCIGVVTVKRKRNIDYLNGTIGSMLAGLTEEERSAISVQLVFADPDPSRHPEYNQTWLDVVDSWSPYNVSDEQFEQILRWKKADQVQEKGTFDYTYILQQCLEHTNAPYIAVFEDDIIFAEGWLPKALSALSKIRQKSTDWLYLRLFYTEAQVGWDKDVDAWYSHPMLWLALCLVLQLTTTLGLYIFHKRKHSDRHVPLMLVIGWFVLPIFTLLIFMIGKNSLIPFSGLHRMDQKGCCTQALIYPRHHVSDLAHTLLEREAGQTDLEVDKWADELGLARYALSPQVVQHVGLVSTRGMPKKYTRQTWAYYFEASNEERLRREHEDLARWGIWRTTREDYADIQS